MMPVPRDMRHPPYLPYQAYDVFAIRRHLLPKDDASAPRVPDIARGPRRVFIFETLASPPSLQVLTPIS
jgi:hypothetical protein